jgi:DnaJ-class molecular chaperone
MVLIKCPRCKGSGFIRGSDQFSEMSNPRARIDNSIVGMFFDNITGVRVECPLCDGAGYVRE